MSARLHSLAAKRSLPFCLVVAVSAWIAFSTSTLGDYPGDAGPAVDALVNGHFSAFLNLHPDMGPVSILLRAPFAALGGDELSVYHWGSLPCLIAAGLLGLYLARLAGRRGSGLPAQALLVTICLVNPLTFAALEAGHPEEILTAALAIGAVAVASQGHSARAALLLGLAVASKQWAVIAILPVLMALPSGRIRAALGAAAISLALFLPTFLADPNGFLDTQRSLAVETQNVTPWSAWFPTASATTHAIPETGMSIETYHASGFLAGFSHPLIVLVAILAPLAVALRRRSFGLSGADAMALLALLALLRCALDPVDNLYYHEPLLLAFAGWDALGPRGLPVRALAGAATLELLSRWAQPPFDLHEFNAIYLAIAITAAIAVAFALLRAPHARNQRRLIPDARFAGLRVEQMSGH
jgi:hypothetical protein